MAPPLGPWFLEDPPQLPESDPNYLCEFCRRVNFGWMLNNGFSGHPEVRQRSNELTPRIGYDTYRAVDGEDENAKVVANRHSAMIPLGLLEDILRKRSCVFRRLVSKAICIAFQIKECEIETHERGPDSWKARKDHPIAPYCELDNGDQGRLEATHMYVLAVTIYPGEAVGRSRLSERIELQQLTEDFVPYRGRRICNSRIDFDGIGHWTQRFSVDKPVSYGIESKGFRVVDVVNQCIVDHGISGRYIALSYVWGTAQSFQLTGKNLGDMTQKNALRDRAASLPRTIVDAITLVFEIGERYLWVDSLCIVQDDTVSKMKQINQMAKIYAMALFTIIATHGRDCNAGLPDVQSSSRVWTQHVESVQGIMLANRRSYLSREHTVWRTRAWTFQELHLSSRTMTFTAEGPWLQSEHGFMEEDVHESSKVHDQPYLRGRIGAMDSAVPRVSYREVNIRMYANAVEDYTTRKLADLSDILAAFSGFMNMLKPQFRGDFIFGMPVTELSTALLWKPVHTSTCQKIQIEELLVPSWSWSSSNIPVTWDCGNILDMEHHSRVLWIDIDGQSCTDDDIRLKGSTNTMWEHPYGEETFNTWFVEAENADARFLHPVAPEDCRDKVQLLAPRSNLLTLEAWVASFPVSHGRDDLDRGIPTASFYSKGGDHNVCALAMLDSNGLLAGCVDVPHAVSPALPTIGISIALSRTCIITNDAAEDNDKHINEPPDNDSDVELARTTSIPTDKFSEMASWDGLTETSCDETALKYFEDHPEEEPPTAFSIAARHGFDQRVYDLSKPWCLYDVMMIEEKDGVAYRLGIGTCHIDAVHQAGAVWKRIQLG